MADRVHALRTGRSARSLRPPPLAGPSAQAKGKQPLRPNPQFEAYHNPWRLPDEPVTGFWAWCFGPSSSSKTSHDAPKPLTREYGGYDRYGRHEAYGRYGGYGEWEDEMPEAKGAARWLKPLVLVFIVALLMAFVALVPPPSYESRERDRNSTHGLTVQSAESGEDASDLSETTPGTWDLPDELTEAQEHAQRIFRVVHRPR